MARHLENEKQRGNTGIFACTTYQEWLHWLNGRLQKGGSLRIAAKVLGYSSPNSVTAVARGERLPGTVFMERLALQWELTPGQKDYAMALVEIERCHRSGKTTEVAQGRLFAANPDSADQVQVTEGDFMLIAEWYHLVVKALVATRGFRQNFDWLTRRLRGKVSVSQLKRSFDLLEHLGLIERVGPNGKDFRVTKLIRTSRDISSLAIRKHHEGMIHRALEALHEQAPEARDISATTFAMDVKQLPQAKAVIDEFREEFRKRFQVHNGDSVVQLNLQFFQHTMEVI